MSITICKMFQCNCFSIVQIKASIDQHTIEICRYRNHTFQDNHKVDLFFFLFFLSWFWLCMKWYSESRIQAMTTKAIPPSREMFSWSCPQLWLALCCDIWPTLCCDLQPTLCCNPWPTFAVTFDLPCWFGCSCHWDLTCAVASVLWFLVLSLSSLSPDQHIALPQLTCSTKIMLLFIYISHKTDANLASLEKENLDSCHNVTD